MCSCARRLEAHLEHLVTSNSFREREATSQKTFKAVIIILKVVLAESSCLPACISHRRFILINLFLALKKKKKVCHMSEREWSPDHPALPQGPGSLPAPCAFCVTFCVSFHPSPRGGDTETCLMVVSARISEVTCWTFLDQCLTP